MEDQIMAVIYIYTNKSMCCILEAVIGRKRGRGRGSMINISSAHSSVRLTGK